MCKGVKSSLCWSPSQNYKVLLYEEGECTVHCFYTKIFLGWWFGEGFFYKKILRRFWVIYTNTHKFTLNFRSSSGLWAIKWTFIFENRKFRPKHWHVKINLLHPSEHFKENLRQNPWPLNIFIIISAFGLFIYNECRYNSH